MIQLQKAKRSLARIKLAVGGPSGSGKTMSSLLIAYGLIQGEHPDWTPAMCWDKVCVIDTENGSACLYVGTSVGATRIGEYYTIPMSAPYEPAKYIDSIHAAEQAGMSVIIVDSYSHSWVGTGGALEKVGKIAARSGNSYTAWRDVTPEQTKLLDCILQSPCHIICTIRAKTEYIQTKDNNGKTVIKNVGMGLQARDGTDFEFSTVFQLDNEQHTANATKDRTGLFDGKYFTITPETGKEIYQWLSTGAPEKPAVPAPQPAVTPTATEQPAQPETPAAPAQAAPVAQSEDLLTQAQKMTGEVFKARYNAEGADKQALKQEMKDLIGMIDVTKCTDIEALRKAYAHFKG